MVAAQPSSVCTRARTIRAAMHAYRAAHVRPICLVRVVMHAAGACARSIMAFFFAECAGGRQLQSRSVLWRESYAVRGATYDDEVTVVTSLAMVSRLICAGVRAATKQNKTSDARRRRAAAAACIATHKTVRNHYNLKKEG